MDYRRDYEYRRRHHRRFVARVEREGVPCQECGAMGGYTERINEYGGPWYACGWCEGTGKVTRWLRGLWLRTHLRARRLRRGTA